MMMATAIIRKGPTPTIKRNTVKAITINTKTTSMVAKVVKMVKTVKTMAITNNNNKEVDITMRRMFILPFPSP